MISSKELYSNSFEEYRLTDEQLAVLQKTLLNMFKDVKAVFDKYNIDYMMAGGSLLGTIRHQGFIPWDDDIDIMLTRDEFYRFRKVFQTELGTQYILAEPTIAPQYISKMPKIYLRDSVFTEITTAGQDMYHMVFIDLFIIENVPAPGIKRRFNSFFYDIAYKGSSLCIDYLYPSPVILDKCVINKNLNRYYNMRRRIGFLFSHIGGIDFYLKMANNIASKYGETGWKGIPAGFSYCREIFPTEVFSRITTGCFCGLTVKIPVEYDRYLSNLYGHYMEIPPKNKQEYHTVYRFEVNIKEGVNV